MRKSTLPFWIRTITTEGEGGGDSHVEGEDVEQNENGDSGNDSDTDSEDVESDDDDDESDDEGANKLGDAGKKALDRMKAERNAARKELREYKAKHEPKSKEAAGADARFAQKILRSEIKAAAAGKLADPADAHRFLDLEQFEVGEDGDVDEDEIAEAIDDLLEKKPYLAAQTQGERRFKGGGGNGVRKETRLKQFTEADLERMSPEQIEKARKDGRLDRVLGITR